jgi:glycerate kinase
VRATTRTYASATGGAAFAALIPEDALVAGRNDVQVYLIDRDRRLTKIQKRARNASPPLHRMRVLIATDSFKGTLDAAAACAVIARGVLRADPAAEVDLCPLADGGEGTAAVVHGALGGEWIERDVTGPLDAGARARAYLWIARPRPIAVIDLAAASGLTLVARERLDPMRATTRGTGELIADALDRGARRVWLALGGSATVDGGAGIATALGWRLLDDSGNPISPVAAASSTSLASWRRRRGARSAREPRGASAPAHFAARFLALRDVENPLLGARGAASVFGPQKGATPAMVERLDRGLARLATVIERDLGLDARRLIGGGAAGGVGAAAVAFLGARLVAGGRLVLRLARFDSRLRRADLVITGEGRLDSQSLEGKVVSAVAGAAKRRGVPVAVVAGRVALDPAVAAARGIVAVEAAAGPSSRLRSAGPRRAAARGRRRRWRTLASARRAAADLARPNRAIVDDLERPR